MIVFNIWEIFGIIAIVLLAVFLFNKNIFLFGFMAGLMVGIMITITTFFKVGILDLLIIVRATIWGIASAFIAIGIGALIDYVTKKIKSKAAG